MVEVDDHRRRGAGPAREDQRRGHRAGERERDRVAGLRPPGRPGGVGRLHVRGRGHGRRWGWRGRWRRRRRRRGRRRGGGGRRGGRRRGGRGGGGGGGGGARRRGGRAGGGGGGGGGGGTNGSGVSGGVGVSSCGAVPPPVNGAPGLDPVPPPGSGVGGGAAGGTSGAAAMRAGPGASGEPKLPVPI